VFILYAILIGLLVGFLVGGRPAGIAEIHLRWSWVILGGLLVQVLLFSEPVSERIGVLGPPIYVGSTVAVIGAILANRSIPGMLIVALGAASNLAAIVANGGYMPVSAEAAAAMGGGHSSAYSNSALIPDPMLAPLTDIFALPVWLPFANVFSVGDVLIGIGVAVVIVKAMRIRPAPTSTAATPAVGA
jgi:galactitol-specific phosphotransferase system IIC component